MLYVLANFMLGSPAPCMRVLLAGLLLAAGGCGWLRPAPTPILPAEELYAKGENDLAKQRHDEARESFKKIVERHPTSSYAPRARFLIGESHYRDGDFDKAIREFETFLSFYPRHQVADLVQVRAPLGEIAVAQAQLLAQLADGAAHRPLGVEQLVPDQRPRPLQGGAIVGHHPMGVEDVSLLALAEALADGAQLLDAVLDGVIEAGQLPSHLIGRDVEPRHPRASAVDGMHLPDGDTGRCRNADELGQAPEAYQVRRLAGGTAAPVPARRRTVSRCSQPARYRWASRA